MMNSEIDPLGDDAVGYGKPPKKNQFKKGKSGNPKGRPKGPGRLDKIIEKFGAAKIDVIENGVKRTISKAELMIAAMYSKASKGDVGAARLLTNLLEKAQEAKQNEVQDGYSEEDMNVLLEQGDWQAMLVQLRAEASGNGTE